MKKRFCAIILAMAMLTGCGSSGGTPASKNSEVATPTVNNSETDKETTNTTTENVKQTYVKPEMKGEISISTVEQWDFIDTAAQLFMEKYPEVTVTVNNFRTIEIVELEGGVYTSNSGEKEGETDEDYLSLLNTQIMTGKADDIIFTDSIPINKYIEMGAFVDLSDYLNQSPEISAETHDMNAFEMVKAAEGGLYELPLVWAPGTIINFDKGLADASGLYLDENTTSISYADALQYAKQMIDATDLPNTYLELGNSALSTAYQLVAERMDEFVDISSKTVNFDNKEFIDILNYAKELEDAGYYDTEGTLDFYNMEYHIGLQTDYDVQTAYFALKSDSEQYGTMPQANADGSVSGRASFCVGITSGSENKELAWEFIKFMLSDEMQTNPSLYWSGVNLKGREANIESSFQMYNGDSGDVALEDYTALLNSWYAEINCYVRQDAVIANQFLFPEILSYFNGEQTAEDTAEALQSKIDKYLNE